MRKLNSLIEMTEGKPRVLHLITRFIDGGAEDELIQTVKGLHEEYSITVGHGEEYMESNLAELRDYDINTIKFPLIRHYNPILAVGAVATVAYRLYRDDIDIVHTHSTEAGIIGRLAARLSGVPAVHTVHGIPFTNDRTRTFNAFVQAAERLAALYSEKIITNTPKIKQEYLRRGIGHPKQYTVIPSGIDIETFREAKPTEDMPGDRPRVLMVARLVQGKGFDVLLDAVEKIDDVSDFTVCIAGDGPLRSKLKKEIAIRGKEERVRLLGYRDDISQVMAASDLLVLPSYREGMPRVITEAMASGLPVVATDIAGIPDQIDDGETGFLIPVGDEDALADCIRNLLSNEELRSQFGARAQTRVKEEFSIERTRKLSRAEYEDVLGN